MIDIAFSSAVQLSEAVQLHTALWSELSAFCSVSLDQIKRGGLPYILVVQSQARLLMTSQEDLDVHRPS